MKTQYSNATVRWQEREIIQRENLVSDIYQILKETWGLMNKAVRFERVETPILTPETYLDGHIKEGFPMIKTESNGFLRPEIAGGIFQCFSEIYPQKENRDKQLPICLWQSGKSFREESNPDTMRASKLRLREFWQLEFELICSISSQAKYMENGILAIQSHFKLGSLCDAEDLPHYSNKTIDWHIKGLEVAGCSIRHDLNGYLVHEISIGLDRLLAIINEGCN